MTTTLATMTESESNRLAGRIRMISQELHAPLIVAPDFSEQDSPRFALSVLLSDSRVDLNSAESPSEAVAGEIDRWASQLRAVADAIRERHVA